MSSKTLNHTDSVTHFNSCAVISVLRSKHVQFHCGSLTRSCLRNDIRLLTAYLRRLSDCITLIRDWMADNRLKLNEDKTQVIWLGTRQQLNKITEQSLILPNATVQSTS